MKKVISLFVVLVLGGAAGWYFYSTRVPEEHPSVLLPVPETVPEPAPAVSYPVSPPVETAETAVEPLPSLADSDQALVEALSALIGAETLGRHFVLEQVIDRVVATIDSLDSRQVAPLVLPVKPLPGSFQVSGDEEYVSSPQNTARYESLMGILASVEVERLVAVYRRYYPLFQESYATLGHGDAYFNDRLVEIVDHLLETPQLPAGPVLVKVESVYKYADPGLESLSAGQKMILRSGPENARTIKEQLKAIRYLLTN